MVHEKILKQRLNINKLVHMALGIDPTSCWKFYLNDHVDSIEVDEQASPIMKLNNVCHHASMLFQFIIDNLVCLMSTINLPFNYVTFTGHFVKVSNMWYLGPIQLIGPTCPKDQILNKSLKVKYLMFKIIVYKSTLICF